MGGELGSIWWGLLLLGLAAGILSGMLGLGSGTILIPVLLLVFAFAQKSAQGTALMVMVPMTALGAFLYWRDPSIKVDVLPAAILVAGALVGSFIGWRLASHVPGHILRKLFAVYLLIIAAKLLIFTPWSRVTPPQLPADEDRTALIENGEISDI